MPDARAQIVRFEWFEYIVIGAGIARARDVLRAGRDEKVNVLDVPDADQEIADRAAHEVDGLSGERGKMRKIFKRLRGHG